MQTARFDLEIGTLGVDWPRSIRGRLRFGWSADVVPGQASGAAIKEEIKSIQKERIDARRGANGVAKSADCAARG